MYTKRGMTYADPYKMLRGNGLIAYQAKGDGFEEIDAPTADLTVSGNLAHWANGLVAMSLDGIDTYDKVKTKLVKIRYSNDDQIAVLCNADPEELARMEAWRSWAADVAKRIFPQH